MDPEDMNPGAWEVGIDPEVPNMVCIKLSEIESDGVKFFQFYLPPKDADDFVSQINEFTQYIRDNA